MTGSSLWRVALTTQLRCRVGEVLTGAGGGSPSFTPRAAALLATRNCLAFESWKQVRGFVDRSSSTDGTRGRREMWQLTRDDGADVWLDYDHGTRELVLLEPIETTRPVGNPERHVPGRQVVVERHGIASGMTATRHGFARVTEIEGGFAMPLDSGDVFEYADLAGSGGRVAHVRRTTNRLGSTTFVYAGRVVGVSEQMNLFGRWLSHVPSRHTPMPLTPGEKAFGDWFTTRFVPTSITLLLMLLGALFGCEPR